MTIAELITTDLALIENALAERLSPSLKRAAGDILGWYMDFIKVIIGADSEFLRLRGLYAGEGEHSIGLVKRALLEALYDWRQSLEQSPFKIQTHFDFDIRMSGRAIYMIGLTLPEVPGYWRLRQSPRPAPKASEPFTPRPSRRRPGTMTTPQATQVTALPPKPLRILFVVNVDRGEDKTWIQAGGSFNEKIPFLRIDLILKIPWQLESQLLSQIKPEVVNSIYHELRHLYQTTPGAEVTLPKEIPSEYKWAFSAGGNPRAYYLAPIEIDSVSTASYREARNTRRPLEDVLVKNMLRATKSKAIRALKDAEFPRDYATALVAALERKYPETKGKLSLRRILQKELAAWHAEE